MAYGPVKVSVATRDRLRILSALLERTQAEIVEIALDEYVEKRSAELARRLERAGGLLDVRTGPGPLEELRRHRERIEEIAARHGAANIRVFGSVARGTAGPFSDVDLLVDLEPGSSLLDHSALVAEMRSALGRDIDVTEPDSLHPLIRDRVLAEAEPL